MQLERRHLWFEHGCSGDEMKLEHELYGWSQMLAQPNAAGQMRTPDLEICCNSLISGQAQKVATLSLLISDFRFLLELTGVLPQ